MGEISLSINRLKKTYPGGVRALKGVDLEVGGGVFGLLGPNGAGKTTLMKIVATLLDPDEGSVRLGEIDMLADRLAARAALGYLPQDFGLYPSLTAAQMLDYLAKLKGITSRKEREAQVAALLERVNLWQDRRRRLGEYSGGMRQRFGIAQALIGRPRLLIIDEPTAGLDPQERVRFHNLISEVSAGAVVILSTHIASDVSNLCSRMAVISGGEILASCSPLDALNEMAGRVWEAVTPREIMGEIKARFRVISSQACEGGFRVRVFSENGPPGADFSPATPSLEDYYLQLVAGRVGNH